MKTLFSLLFLCACPLLAAAQQIPVDPNGGLSGISYRHNAATDTRPVPDMSGEVPPKDSFSSTPVDSVLAIHLSSFGVSVSGGICTLSWVSAREDSGDRYLPERSFDGHLFQSIAELPARFGFGGGRYSLRDLLPVAQRTCYRLRMIDQDGRIHFSAIRCAEPIASGSGLVVVRNPVEHLLIVRCSTPGGEGVAIWDATGKKVSGFHAAEGETQWPVGHLPAGHYTIVSSSGRHRGGFFKR